MSSPSRLIDVRLVVPIHCGTLMDAPYVEHRHAEATLLKAAEAQGKSPDGWSRGIGSSGPRPRADGETTMHVISVNVGLPRTLTYGNRDIHTGGNKKPVNEAMLRVLNFDGDGQADLSVHGGPDRAVCVYSFDHYPFWEEWAGEKLAPGAFSENLTIDGIAETAVSIGDTFACGEALVQVSQPRLPCSKLASKRGRTDLPEAIRATLFTGFYVRVLREGVVRVGDAFEPVSTHAAGVTVAFASQVMLAQRTSPDDIDRVLAVEELSGPWRETLTKRRGSNE